MERGGSGGGVSHLGAGVGAEHEGLGGVDGDEHAGLLRGVGWEGEKG